MALGTRPGIARWLHATRSAGLVPVIAGVASAFALVGAAFYTVEQATCAEGGQYIRHANHVEFVGGCVDPDELPPAETGRQYGGTPPVEDTEHSNYRP